MAAKRKVITCSNCEETGHNARGCDKPPKGVAPKVARSKPKKAAGAEQAWTVSTLERAIAQHEEKARTLRAALEILQTSA